MTDTPNQPIPTAQEPVVEVKTVTVKKSKAGVGFLFLLLVATWAAVAYAGNYLWERYDALQAEVSALTSGPANTNEQASAAQSLADRVNVLEAQLTSLNTNIASVAGATPVGPEQITQEISKNATVAELQQKVKKIEAKLSTVDEAVATNTRRSTLSSLVVAVSDLRENVNKGKPFSEELASVEVLGDKNPFVKTNARVLGKFAESGVENVDQLKERFNREIIPLANHVKLENAEKTNTITSLFSSLSGVVKVRKVGENTQGTTAEDIIARAEAKLRKNDLAGAVQELRNLQGDSAAKSADWIKAANNYFAAQTAVNTLYTNVIKGSNIEEPGA